MGDAGPVHVTVNIVWGGLVVLLGTAVTGRPTLLPSYRPFSDTTITIRTVSSTLQFDPPRISVRQGTRVTLRLVNEGTLPHNLVIAKTEDDLDALAEAASKVGGDYVPLALKEKMITWTTLASPGQTVEVTFTVPAAGEYPYACLMSGHSMSMLGVLRSLR
jgi:plastocyanin